MANTTSKFDRDKRKKKLKAENQEIMREKMDFGRALKTIGGAEAQLIQLIKAVDEPSNGRIGAIRALLDSNWRRINKLLPDLKASENTDHVTISGENTDAILISAGLMEATDAK